MITIKKEKQKFIVYWEDMGIEFTELPKALEFVETIFKFCRMEVEYEEMAKKAEAYDKIMARENGLLSNGHISSLK